MLQNMSEAEATEKMAYSVGEISQLTSLSKIFIRNQIRDGKLKVRKIGRRVIVLKEDLQKYLEANEN